MQEHSARGAIQGDADMRPLEFLKPLHEPSKTFTLGQAAPTSIVYDASDDLNLADAPAYPHCPVFTAESTWMADINQIVAEGQTWIARLYTYRSCAKGIPSTTANDQAGKTDMNQVIYDVLTPQINKIKMILDFAKSAVQAASDVCRALSTQRAATLPGASINIYFVSPAMYHHVARLFNLLLTLDELKDMKACIINDVSIQKRAAAHLRSAKPELSIEDPQQANQELYNALQQHGWCLQALQQQLAGIPGIVELLFDCANAAALALEQKVYFRPKERSTLLKGSAIALMLISRLENKNAKKLRLDRFVKLYKQTPITTLCGDMSLTFSDFFRRSKQHADFFPANDIAPSLAVPFDLSSTAQQAQLAHTTLLRDLSAHLNMTSADETVALNGQYAEELYALTRQGLNLIADTAARVLDMNAWKVTHPVNATGNAAIPPEASSYELAVRYNYTPDEVLHLTNTQRIERRQKMVVMTKTTASKLKQHLPLLKKAIKQYMIDTTQHFATTILAEIHQHAIKKKRNSIEAIKQLMMVLGQIKSSSSRQVGPPSASLGLTQLAFARTMLLSIFGEAERRPKAGLIKEREFKDAHYDAVDAFMEKSDQWADLWPLDETLQQCQDLSDLWFKEFYLEITKQIQFPIDTSLPWLITARLLANDVSDAFEDIFIPLDIYNDAARASLFDLKCQYLFDEVEAETNLCFVQLVFELGQRIYTHYKQAASLTLVERRFKTNLEQIQGFDFGHYDCPKRTYETLLRSKCIHLLGRTVDLNGLLAQSVNQSLRKSIDVAISRFEASDLNYVKDLESLLDVAYMTHYLLSQSLTLDAWEDMLIEVDERTGLNQYGGRVYAHLINELTMDLCPNWCYNAAVSRFLRAPINMVSPPTRSAFAREKVMHHYGSKHLFTLFAAQQQLYRGFIGQQHTDSIIRLIGMEMVPRLVDDLSQHIRNLMKSDVTAYVDAVNKGMPYTAKLPPFEFGLKGAFDYFMVILKPLLTYRDMKTGVFQSLREIGNAITFVTLLQTSQETMHWYGDHSLDTHMTQVQDLGMIAASSQLYPAQAETYQQLKATTTYLTHQIERSKIELVFMDTLRQELQTLRTRWEGNDNVTQYLTEEHVREFHRVWSVAFFMFNLPPQSSNEYTNRQLFGDAFLIGGTSLIFLLDESSRFQAFDFTHYLRYTFQKEVSAMTSSGSSTGSGSSNGDTATENGTLDYHAGSVINLHGAQLGGNPSAPTNASSNDKGAQIKDKQLYQVMRFLETAKFSIDMSTKTLDRLCRLKDELCLDLAY